MASDIRSPGASLERALRHWRERGVLLEQTTPRPVVKPLTITVSRERGAGGAEVARGIASQLGWPLYDRELVERIAKDSGVRAQLVDELDEKRPSWLTECFEGFAAEKHLTGAGYAIRLKKVLLALSCHGECVVLGRGSSQIIPAGRSFRLRLIADQQDRVQHVARTTGVTADEARANVDRADKERNDFVNTYFQGDATDPHGYDLLINTSRIPRSLAVDLVLSAVASRQAANSPANQ